MSASFGGTFTGTTTGDEISCHSALVAVDIGGATTVLLEVYVHDAWVIYKTYTTDVCELVDFSRIATKIRLRCSIYASSTTWKVQV